MKGTCGVISYFKNVEDKLTENTNKACWAGVKNHGGQTLYIPEACYKKHFGKEKKVVELLVNTVNEITPCEMVEHEGVKYISIKLLKNYDASLILLNFIRNLWWEQNGADNQVFFETLKESKREDALERLMEANIAASKKVTFPDHSNCRAANILKIKKTADLLSYKFSGYAGTTQFLTM